MELSVIIAAREEEFLQRTIDSVLSASSDKTEVIAILDGYKPEISEHPRLKIIHNQNSVGQRAAVNQGARESKAKIIGKLDAHCLVADSFDEVLMADCEPDWVVIPRMYVLNAFHWVCQQCLTETGQGPIPLKCESCGGVDFERKIKYMPKYRKKTDYMWFDRDLRVKYFDSNGLGKYGENAHGAKLKYSHKIRDWTKGDITDVMCGVGACWFLHRDYYWDVLGGLDENHGSWGQMAVEIAMKTWLSGGRHVVNKKTWFAHLFRTRSGFSWPYENPTSAQEKARRYSKDLWFNNKWSGQKRNLNWLINKFSPLPGWEDYEKENPIIVMPDHIIAKMIRKDSKNMETGATILYYTANKIPEYFATKVKDQIKYASQGMHIISISQKPITDMGENICVGDIGQSCQNVYKQILIGALKAKTKYVICCEDDTLYIPDYFEYRPKKEPFAYNLNRWNLHTTKNIYSYWRRIVMSQCIAEREVLIKCLEERNSIDIPTELCGEPSRFEGQLGLPEYNHETFQTSEPNVVFVHGDGLLKRKRLGPDAEPKTDLEPWGEVTALLNHVYQKSELALPVITKQKKIPFRKHSKHTYIKQYVFNIDELMNNRLSYIHSEKVVHQKNFLKVFPDFIKRVASGEKFTEEKFEQSPYFDYLVSRLARCDRKPVLTEKGKKRVLFLMRESVKLYHSIKENGLRSPLDMYIENDRLILHRGERRLEILNILGRKRIPCRVFKDKEKFNSLRPDTEWGITIPDKNTIHELAIQQFVRVGGKATDKYWAHGYTKLYDKEIGHLRTRKKPIKLLEIGVKKGASLELWKEAFPKGEIFGIDKDDININGFKIFHGEQQNTTFLKEVGEEVGQFDVIIDDGSHVPEHEKISFETLWPYLAPKGYYIIEDLHHNYKSDRGLMINCFKNYIDKIFVETTVASVNFYYNICFVRKN